MTTLGALASSRANHFNLIRMLAAVAVLISHSYPLSSGSGNGEPLYGWLGISLGELAVITFFSVSGFFISLSRDRSPSTVDFFCARFLRVYPGLALVLLLTVFVIGPVFTTLGTLEYFRSTAVYSYLSNNLMLFSMRFQLPGVFEDNPFPGVNGSLWTLFYEVTLYVLVGGLGAFSFYQRGHRFTVFLFIYASVYIAFRVLAATTGLTSDLHRMHYFFTWGMPFVLGMSLYRYRNRIQHRAIWLLPLALIAVCSSKQPWFFEAFVAAWTYLIIYLGFNRQTLLERYNNLGDYSYGVYIYAFPIQEITAHTIKGISPVGMMLSAFPVVLLAAVLSWHYIEKPAMARRHAFTAQVTLRLRRLKAYWAGVGKRTV